MDVNDGKDLYSAGGNRWGAEAFPFQSCIVCLTNPKGPNTVALV